MAPNLLYQKVILRISFLQDKSKKQKYLNSKKEFKKVFDAQC